MAFPAYTKPNAVARVDTRVTDWELRNFAQAAPTYNQFDQPPPPQVARDDAARSEHATWERRVDGFVLDATAWFVNVAHAPGAPAQWMLTAAHNFVNMVPKHDVNGRITDFGREEPAFADAVYIVAGWGATAVGAYANRVSIMSGYSDDVVHNIHLDGAALHIPTATIPAAFWNQAPQIASLPHALAPRLPQAISPYLSSSQASPASLTAMKRSKGCISPAIMQTLQTCHRHSHARRYPDWCRQPPPGYYAPVNEATVYTAQGVSGSPMVVLAAGAATILGSVNTSGIVAGFTQAAPAVALEVVDPAALLMAVYSPRMVWQAFNAGPLGNWHVLRKE
ncbi:hypothetical protein FB451DRAFT_1189966 [Mycena latifolia]|nr:hypothetical protein FB451DRAFT_1189966 [Mycena latifolia]